MARSRVPPLTDPETRAAAHAVNAYVQWLELELADHAKGTRREQEIRFDLAASKAAHEKLLRRVAELDAGAEVAHA